MAQTYSTPPLEEENALFEMLRRFQQPQQENQNQTALETIPGEISGAAAQQSAVLPGDIARTLQAAQAPSVSEVDARVAPFDAELEATQQEFDRLRDPTPNPRGWEAIGEVLVGLGLGDPTHFQSEREGKRQEALKLLREKRGGIRSDRTAALQRLGIEADIGLTKAQTGLTTAKTLSELTPEVPEPPELELTELNIKLPGEDKSTKRSLWISKTGQVFDLQRQEVFFPEDTIVEVPEDPEVKSQQKRLAELYYKKEQNLATTDELAEMESIEDSMTLVAGMYARVSQMVDPQGRTFYVRNADGTIVPAPPGMRPQYTAAERTQVVSMDEILRQLDLLEGYANDNKEIIGPISGWLASIKLVTTGLEPEQNEMFRISKDISDSLLRARSGAQINEQEYRRLTRLVPQVNSPVGKFFSDLAGFRANTLMILKRRTGALPLTSLPETATPGSLVPAGPVSAETGPAGREQKPAFLYEGSPVDPAMLDDIIKLELEKRGESPSQKPGP